MARDRNPPHPDTSVPDLTWRAAVHPPAAAQVAVFLHRQRTGSYTLDVSNEGPGILELTTVVHWNDRRGHQHRQLTVGG